MEVCSYVTSIAVEPVVDCAAVSDIFLLHFGVPSGEITHQRIEPPRSQAR